MDAVSEALLSAPVLVKYSKPLIGVVPRMIGVGPNAASHDRDGAYDRRGRSQYRKPLIGVVPRVVGVVPNSISVVSPLHPFVGKPGDTVQCVPPPPPPPALCLANVHAQ